MDTKYGTKRDKATRKKVTIRKIEHVCDPNTFPECCWVHKRSSILYPMKSGKTYCEKCGEYHNIDVSNFVEYSSNSTDSSCSYNISTTDDLNNDSESNISNDKSDRSMNNVNDISLSASNTSMENFIKESKVINITNLENYIDGESVKSETMAIEQSLIPESEKIQVDWNNDTKQIIANNINTRKLTRRQFNRNIIKDENTVNKDENIVNKDENIVNEDNIDKIITRKFDFEEYRKIKPLGKGGFGTVYLCKNPDGKPYAMKKIESKVNRGIPCLMEASIMATYRHDYLTHVICAKAKPDGLYIIMPIGSGGDLSKWRSSNNPTAENIKCVLYQISQAILFLHELSIIHGDIKCSNILVFNTDNFSVKLSDFNLSSVKSWESNLKVCTATHRPIEVWRGDKWDEKIDIWSFGCALYELKYGHGLIPYQGQTSGKEHYMNALFDWVIYGKGGNGKHSVRKNKPKYYNVMYNKARICKNLHNKAVTPFMRLMFKMLKSEPTERPTIHEIIKSNYLNGMKSVKGKRSKRIQNSKNKYLTEKINDSDNIVLISEHKKFDLDLFDQKNIDLLKNELSYYTEDSEILEMAVKIYGRYRLITNINNNWTKLTCVWIARKMIRKKNYDIRIPIDSKNTELRETIYQTERDICETLGFRLHLH